MRSIWIKAINLILVLGILLGYDTLVQVHAQQDYIARLSAQLAGSEQTMENMRAGVEELAGVLRRKTAAAETSSVMEEAGTKDTGEDEAVEEHAELPGMADGEYEGEAQGFGGPIAVSVSVEDGRIASVTVLSADGEDPAYLDTAGAVCDAIVEAQSADVDTVSGATFSSAGIRDAAAQALEKAGS